MSHLARFEDGPHALRRELRAVVAELRMRLGFDDATGAKVAESTLDTQHAGVILARLEALAHRTEVLAKASSPPEP